MTGRGREVVDPTMNHERGLYVANTDYRTDTYLIRAVIELARRYSSLVIEYSACLRIWIVN